MKSLLLNFGFRNFQKTEEGIIPYTLIGTAISRDSFFLKPVKKHRCRFLKILRPGRLMNLTCLKKIPLNLPWLLRQLIIQLNLDRLIFFNSYLPHLYRVDSGYEPFRFIHFNIQAINPY